MDTAQGRFLVSPVSHLGYQLAHGQYESGMTAVLEQYLRPGSVFIDLGANEGYFTVIGSRLVGRKGTVIAVEPQSRVQPAIRANLTLNECHNVRVIQALISSRTEKVRLYLTPGLSTGGSGIYRNTQYPLPTETAQGFSFADFMDSTGLDTCDLMKVDIEGAEYDVFMNAGDILKRGLIRNIALEIHEPCLARRGLSGSRLHECLLDCGYKMNEAHENRVYNFVG
jgi:FkbM family methyltransferase